MLLVNCACQVALYQKAKLYLCQFLTASNIRNLFFNINRELEFRIYYYCTVCDKVSQCSCILGVNACKVVTVLSNTVTGVK